MRKFWVRPDGNDEEEDEKFEFRQKIAMISSVIILAALIFIVFPWWSGKTDEYWRREAMRGYRGDINPIPKDTSNQHPFREN